MNTLFQETRDLRARYDEEPSHSDQVALLALQLFDELSPWHSCQPRDRELLHSAALLHDIGWSQTPNGKGHHKASARLIRDHRWKSLTPAEIDLVAQIARYHRKTIPLPSHEPFQELSPPAQRLVMILGGILRLADALDRTHTGRVKKVTAAITPDTLRVYVQAKGNWEAERDMFDVKREMLELAAERHVCCEAAK
jgi:exopolyphosphatase/guanosine-5'-triphosphate,3'-diphosphate pyrophosphatase